jgi:hypothetical protein
VHSFRVLLLSILLAAMAVIATLAVTSVTSLGVLGNQAGRVYVAKDVTADILPPPMYLIEMRLVASQGLEGSMDLATVRSEVVRLTAEYEARVEHWEANPPYGLERELLGPQHAAAGAFITHVNSVYLPATPPPRAPRWSARTSSIRTIAAASTRP